MPPNASNIGAKRRRIDIPERDLSSRIKGKLHHLVKEVNKAAKKAKSFETQKAVKRLKGHRKDASSSKEAEISQLEAQLEILKTIDHEHIATSALRSKIEKDKILSQSPEIKDAVSQELKPGDPSSSTADADPNSNYVVVERRLLSSKTLASGVNAAISGLRAILAPPTEEDEEDDGDDGVEDPTPRKRQKTTLKETSKVASSSTKERHPMLARMSDEDEEEGEDDISIHSGSDDESEGSSQEEHPFTTKSKPAKATSTTKLKPTKQPTAATAKSTSTFLPSLSVGYVRGGSDDSDFSDADVDAAEGVHKNRRGQRARRAIWEKKYGSGANHVKNGNTGSGPMQQRNTNQSRQNAPRPSRPQQQPHNHTQNPSHSKPQFSSSSSTRPPPKFNSAPNSAPVQKDQPLHPSWEAKRKLKEQQSIGIVPPQGKKIVFS